MIVGWFLNFYSKFNEFLPEIERDIAISQIMKMMVTTANNYVSFLLLK